MLAASSAVLMLADGDSALVVASSSAPPGCADASPELQTSVTYQKVKTGEACAAPNYISRAKHPIFSQATLIGTALNRPGPLVGPF